MALARRNHLYPSNNELTAYLAAQIHDLQIEFIPKRATHMTREPILSLLARKPFLPFRLLHDESMRP